MTRIDFYILQGESDTHLQRLACRLVDKAWQRGMRTLLNVADTNTAAQLDELLWTFRDISFLSHARSGEDTGDTRLAALIGCNDEPTEELDLLINLSPQVPAFFSRFERVAELVDSEPQRRLAGRERFRFYRDRGYPLDTHKLR